MSYKERNPSRNVRQMSDEMSESGISEQLQALATEERRHLLQHLLGKSDNTASTTELIEHVADATDTSTEQVRVRTRHNHLPVLAAAEIVDTDPEKRTVSYSGGELVTELLETTTAYGPPSSVP